MKKRIALWDNVKFILILLVVVGHFIEYKTGNRLFKSLYLFIYSFHMPLFIFISGLFHKNINIRKKVITYLMLGITLSIFIFATKQLMGINYTFKLLIVSKVQWFMFALPAFILLAYGLRDMNPKIILPIILMLGSVVNYDNTIGDYLCLSRIVVFFPFYYLGTITNRETLEKLNEKKWLKLSSFLILTSWLILCVFLIKDLYILRPMYTGRNPFPEDICPIGYLVRIFTYLSSTILGFSVIMLTPRKKLPFITSSGKKTLQIYFWHLPIIDLLVTLGILKYLVKFHIPGLFAWMALGTITTIALTHDIFKFPVNYIQNNIDNPNKKI